MIKAVAREIDNYGGVRLNVSYSDLLACGFEYADIIRVKTPNAEFDAFFVPSYRNVGPGDTLIMATEKHEPVLCTYYGNLVDRAGLAAGETYELSLSKKQGYAEGYALHNLKRSKKREDYGKRTDEQFANFRNVRCGNIGENILFRSSTPIDPMLGRNIYADRAAREHGIKTFINLCDTRESAERNAGYFDTYYSKQKVEFLRINTDPDSDMFRNTLVRVVRAIAENDGPYLIHCIEGQDRTGMTVAILECLMGASYDEIIDDYMLTFLNFYGVENSFRGYDEIAGNIFKILRNVFKIDDPLNADLSGCAYDFLIMCGAGREEINKLKERLCGTNV